MARSTTTKALIVCACLAAILLAVFVARHALLEILLTRVLADRGLVLRSVTVSELGFGHLLLEDLRLGSEDQLSIDTVAVTYQPGKLLDGQLRTVAISGLRMTLDLTGEGPPLGEFQALLDTTGETSDGPALPQVRLEDGLIALETPLGALGLAVSGRVTPEAEEKALVDLALGLEGDRARADASLEARLASGGALQGRLTLAGGEIELPEARVLGLAGELDFELLAGRPQAVTARLTAERLALTLADVSPPEFRKAELQFALDPETLTLSGLLESERRAFSAEVSGELNDYEEDPRFTLALAASARHDSLIWDAFALPKPAAGSHRLAFRSAGRLPPLENLGASPPPFDERLLEFLDGSDLEWSGEDLTYPGMLDDLSGALALRGSVADGRLALHLQEDAVLEVAAIAPQLEAAAGLPEALSPALPGPFSLRVKAAGDHAFAASVALDETPRHLELTVALATEGLWRGTLDLASRQRLEITADGGPADFEVTAFSLGGRDLRLPQANLPRLDASGSLAGRLDEFAGRVALDATARGIAGLPLETKSITAELTAVFSQGAEGSAVALDGPGRVAFEAFSLPGRFTAKAPLVLEVAAGSFQLAPADAGGPGQMQGVLALSLPAAEVSLEAGAQNRVAEIEAMALELSAAGVSPETLALQGEAKLAELRLPDDKIALEGLSLSATANGDFSKLDGAFSIAKLFQDDAAAVIAPLSLEGTLARRAKDITLAAQGSWAEIPDILKVTARHDTTTSKGRLEAAFQPPAFARDGLQPKDLFPGAALLENARGQAAATARLDWSPEDLRGLGQTRLEGLSFEAEGIEVRGLSGAVSFADLLTGRSLPGQLLTIERVDPGLPITDLSLRFQLDPEAPNGVLLESGRFSVFSAEVTMNAAPAAAEGAQQDLSFFVEGLQLDQLFETIDAEGFSGSGQLQGIIPVALEAETLVIRDARLEATAPGRLQIKSAEAKALLEAGGEQATLLLEALEDFHYESLTLALANSASNDLELTLSILGNNPAVLEGHPFQFNINLESNIERVLAALLAGYRMSNQALHRLWSLRR